jgi:hypothetical protein
MAFLRQEASMGTGEELIKALRSLPEAELKLPLQIVTSEEDDLEEGHLYILAVPVKEK